MSRDCYTTHKAMRFLSELPSKQYRRNLTPISNGPIVFPLLKRRSFVSVLPLTRTQNFKRQVPCATTLNSSGESRTLTSSAAVSALDKNKEFRPDPLDYTLVLYSHTRPLVYSRLVARDVALRPHRWISHVTPHSRQEVQYGVPETWTAP